MAGTRHDGATSTAIRPPCSAAALPTPPPAVTTAVTNGAPAHVVSLLEVYESPATLFMLMRAELGGDLAAHLAPLPGGLCDEARARGYARSVLRGLEALHAQRVVHRDLKLANVVLSADGEVRIADLGLAERLPEPIEGQPPPLLRTVCGTHDNRAPEMILCGHGARPGYGCAVDLWQMGLLLYEMLYGVHPFTKPTEVETLGAILAADYAFPPCAAAPERSLSNAANDLIRSLLVTDPQMRPTAAECLQHEWLRQC